MSLAVAQERLALYLEAERKVLLSQSYTIGQRTLTRANLREIRDEIDKIQKEIATYNRGGMRVRRVLPRDG